MAAKAAPKHSKGHIEFIGEYEFYEVDGQLFRAKTDLPIVDGRRPGKFVTLGSGIDIALRLARLEAAKPSPKDRAP